MVSQVGVEDIIDRNFQLCFATYGREAFRLWKAYQWRLLVVDKLAARLSLASFPVLTFDNVLFSAYQPGSEVALVTSEAGMVAVASGRLESEVKALTSSRLLSPGTDHHLSTDHHLLSSVHHIAKPLLFLDTAYNEFVPATRLTASPTKIL